MKLTQVNANKFITQKHRYAIVVLNMIQERLKINQDYAMKTISYLYGRIGNLT